MMTERQLDEILENAKGWHGKMAQDDIPALVSEVRRLQKLVPRLYPNGPEEMIGFGPLCAVDTKAITHDRGPIWRNRFDEYVAELRA
jgi:hypothetical protein